MSLERLILDLFLGSLFRTEPQGGTECHGTQATSNSVQSATASDQVEI